jgi:murein L,D-transpeptidase YcbB/YkuD
MLLKIGSKGEDVKKLQQKLGLGADGIFGAATG